MVDWSTTENYDHYVAPTYNADVVSVAVRRPDGTHGLAVSPSSKEAAEVHEILEKELGLLEQSLGGAIAVREDGYQNDLGGAVCVLDYVVEHSGAALVGAAATAVAAKLAHAVQDQVRRYNDRTNTWFDPYADLSEEHVRWCAKVIAYSVYGDDLNLHIDQLVIKPDAEPPVASVTMTASDGAIIAVEVEFRSPPVGVLKSITRTHRYT